MGGLDHLARLMLSNNVEVQSNACGCVTNLAILDENKVRIANSAVLPRLIKLAGSNDLRVQRNAAGALLNLTHTGTGPLGHCPGVRDRLLLVVQPTQCRSIVSPAPCRAEPAHPGAARRADGDCKVADLANRHRGPVLLRRGRQQPRRRRYASLVRDRERHRQLTHFGKRLRALSS